MARFEPPKDHATLLEALARLRGLEWELDLVGDGPLEPAARARAARLGIAGRVRFLGYREDVAPCWPAPTFSRCRRAPRPCRAACWRPCARACRWWLPPLAAFAEAVDNGISGLLVPPQDVAALAAALGALIGESARRQQLGAAARRAYESRFRLERMAEETAALYETVLESDVQS